MLKAYTPTAQAPGFLAALLLFLAAAGDSYAATLSVDPDLGIDTVTIPPTQTVIFTNDCLATPCRSIAYAVSQANSGDTISLASKEFQEHDIFLNRDLVFDNAGPGWVVINAGFQGRHFVVGQNAQVKMNTIKFINGLAAEGGSIINNGNLVLTNCQFIDNLASLGSGGAIVNHGILGAHNSMFHNNRALNLGGAILNTGTASLSNSQIVSNEAGASGGGILNDRTVMIIDSTLALNTAANGGAIDNNEGASLWLLTSVLNGNSATGVGSNGNGGAIISKMHSTTNIHESSLFANFANTSGGAIYNNNSNLILSQSSLYQNTATEDGGALLNIRGDATIDRSTFETNAVTLGSGGAIASGNSADSNIIDSTFFDNEAVYGGALYLFIGTASVSNSTFDSNNAEHGGAVYNEESMASITNSTFSANSAVNNGGAVYDKILTGLTGFLDIANSTLYGNGASTGGAIFSDVVYFYGSRPLRIRNSIITSSSGGDCVNMGDPLTGVNNLVDESLGGCSGIRLGAITPNSIDTLQWNGGATRTHALLAGSNAIDNGQADCPDPASGLPLDSDQRGEPRPPAAGGAVCDIGAYELN